MAKPSTIDQLAADLRKRLIQFLDDPRITQAEATELINDLIALHSDPGVETVSKSAVGRFAQRIDKFAKKNRESQEIAKVFAAQIGNADQNEIGKMTIQMIQTSVFEVMGVLQDNEELDAKDIEGVVEALKGLALVVQRTEKASSINYEREQEIKRQGREEALAEAADTVQSAAEAKGMNKEDATWWREQVLGVRKT